jgi:hypothetical protein
MQLFIGILLLSFLLKSTLRIAQEYINFIGWSYTCGDTMRALLGTCDKLCDKLDTNWNSDWQTEIRLCTTKANLFWADAWVV